LVTDISILSQITPGKSTPKPELSDIILLPGFKLWNKKRGEFKIGDASREGFRALAD
jgi:hypothetical protein